MSLDGYSRARKILRGLKATRHATLLGLLEAALILKALSIGGLLLTLAQSVAFRVPEADSGILGVADALARSGYPPQRWLAGLLRFDASIVPPLATNLGAVAVLGGGLVVVALLATWVRRVRLAKTIQAAGATARALRQQIHRQMTRLSFGPSESIQPIQRMYVDGVRSIQEGLAAESEILARDLPIWIGLLVASIVVHPGATAFLTALILFLLFMMGRRAPNEVARRARLEREAEFQRDLSREDLALIRLFRAFNAEDYEQKRFQQHLEDFELSDNARRARERRLRLGASLWSAGLGALGYAGLIAAVVMNRNLSPAGAAFLAVTFGMTTFLVWKLVRHVQERSWIDLRAREIFEFLSRESDLKQEVGATFLGGVERGLRLSEVQLPRGDGQLSPHRLTLEIPAGQRVALLGPDAVTKRTVAHLFTRLLDPERGQVFIDGRDARDWTLDSLRAQIGVVLKDDLVFSDTVAGNIGMGSPSNTIPKIVEAAKQAHAHQFIRRLPQGYDTVVGPSGLPLSSDERYRVALARLILHDPSVWVLEEPEDLADDDAALLIDDTLNRIPEDRTLVLLTRRPNLLKTCGQWILFDDGAIVASGKPADLARVAKLARYLRPLGLAAVDKDKVA